MHLGNIFAKQEEKITQLQRKNLQLQKLYWDQTEYIDRLIERNTFFMKECISGLASLHSPSTDIPSIVQERKSPDPSLCSCEAPSTVSPNVDAVTIIAENKSRVCRSRGTDSTVFVSPPIYISSAFSPSEDNDCSANEGEHSEVFEELDDKQWHIIRDVDITALDQSIKFTGKKNKKYSRSQTCDRGLCVDFSLPFVKSLSFALLVNRK